MRSAGLALGGGAARGWAHVGVILALVEKKIHITHVAGTSIGAFVGAFIATGTLDVLQKKISTFDWKKGLGYFASLPAKNGMLRGRKITDFLTAHLGVQNMEDASIPLCTVATDLRTGREKTFCRGSIIEAVRASIAVPGIFTPVEKDGLLLVDGGLVNPVPVSTVRRMDAENVIAVDLNKVSMNPLFPVLGEKEPNLLEIIGASANIIEAELTKSRLAVDPPDILIRPDLAHISYLNFSRGDEIVQLGYEATVNSLAEYNQNKMAS